MATINGNATFLRYMVYLSFILIITPLLVYSQHNKISEDEYFRRKKTENMDDFVLNDMGEDAESGKFTEDGRFYEFVDLNGINPKDIGGELSDVSLEEYLNGPEL
jgi:hypothetical protein